MLYAKENIYLKSFPRSRKYFDVYEQISSGQLSGSVGPVHVASIGLADDTANVSNNIAELQHLFQLTLNYCDEYQVELSALKTKLLIFSPFESDYIKYNKLISSIHIGSKKIAAEHGGIIRSVSAGNFPHIQQRMASHRKALGSILFSGMTRRHRANHLPSLQAERIFGAPVSLA